MSHELENNQGVFAFVRRHYVLSYIGQGIPGNQERINEK